MLNIGPQELLIILIIALIVVGPHRLPELGRSLGKGLRELRKAQDEVKRTIKVELDGPPNGSTKPTAVRTSTDSAGVAPDATASSADGGSDPTPAATEPLPASEVREISRSLGRSLSELRRAKEEVQRSFRVDLTGPPNVPSAPKPAGSREGTASPSPAPPETGQGGEGERQPDGPSAG